MANIFKISDEFLRLLNRIEEENEGELTAETSAELEIQEENLLTKAENYVSIIKLKEGVVATVDQEIKRLQAIKKRELKVVEWLSNNLEFAVKTFGEIEVGTNKLKLRKSSSIFVEDVNALPSEFKTVKVTEAANKAEIKKALKAGKQIEGCAIIEKQSLKIN